MIQGDPVWADGKEREKREKRTSLQKKSLEKSDCKKPGGLFVTINIERHILLRGANEKEETIHPNNPNDI